MTAPVCEINPRTAANRLNALKSTGPRTPEGKAKSALNALKHGLCSTAALLSNESEDLFNAHREGYIAHFAPTGTVQLDLVDQIVAASWRLRRALAMETAAYEREMVRRAPECEDFTEDVRLFTAIQSLTDNSRFPAHLSRYESRIHRMYHRAMDTLTQLQRPAAQKTLQNEPKPEE